MGFFPVMQAKLERITDYAVKEHYGRMVRAQVFYEPLNKWIVKDFPGYDPTEALAWIGEQMKQVEM